MNCIETICLYLKEYISDKQFEKIFHDYMEVFQQSLDEDVYLNILFTSFNSKQERICLETELQNYILGNYGLIYRGLNDVYVEHIIVSDRDDIVAKILREKYKKKEEVDIDCSMINTRSELIAAVKNALQYPHFCGNNWDAIEDLIYDVIFPQKLVLCNWPEVADKLPHDAAILKDILERNSENRCVIIYA